MGNQLAIVERELTARQPLFLDVLPKSLSPARLFRTVMVSLERTPRLMQCTQQSIINAAMTAAVLGLEVDGVTGQGFLVPYKDVATFQIGYKGYNTLAARAGITINGGVVREGDVFDFKLGTGAYVDHRPKLNGNGRKIIGAWATAEANGRPAIVAVMSFDEILAIKARSAGAKKQDSPWNDMNGPGFAAMCEKTVKRRLARSLPLTVMTQAAALDDQHEIGNAAYLAPTGDLQVVGEASTADYPPQRSEEQPQELLTPVNPPQASPTDDAKAEARRIVQRLGACEDELALDMALHEETATLEKIKAVSQVAYEHIMTQAGKRRTDLLQAA